MWKLQIETDHHQLDGQTKQKADARINKNI